MPKTEIPEWWDYRNRGGHLTLRARHKFPVVALAFLFDKINSKAVQLHLFIDGEQVDVQRQQFLSFTVVEDHVLLCDLRVLFSDEEWESLDARIGHNNNWKKVQVKCEPDITPVQWGVYVYKPETSMDDIGMRPRLIPRLIPRSARFSTTRDGMRPRLIRMSARFSTTREELNAFFRNRYYKRQVPPSSSESLQIVVENLKRVTAPRGKRESDDDDCNLEWLAETATSSDDNEEGELDTDANNGDSNEMGNETLRGHVAKRAEREVTKYQGTGSSRRTTRKRRASNWTKDFVGFKRWNQPKTDQARCESHSSFLSEFPFSLFIPPLAAKSKFSLPCQVISFLGTSLHRRPYSLLH